MSQLKVDMKQLEKLSKDVHRLVNGLLEEANYILDENQDTFIRYMSYSRLIAFMYMFSTTEKIITNSFHLGFDLNNDIFHTKEFKENGWDVSKIEKNPFFEHYTQD